MFINYKSFCKIANEIYNNNSHYLNRKIIQIHPITLQIIKIWNSATIIENVLNYNRKLIWEVCKYKRIHHKGYYWRYLDEFINDKYIKCDKNGKLDIFNLFSGGSLKGYIEPCYIPIFGERFGKIPYINGYIISTFRRVFNIKHFPYIYEVKSYMRDGYENVNLMINNIQKKFLLHKLIADTFITNPNNYHCVNHKDENKSNNTISNLEHCNSKYNTNYGTCILRRSIKNGKIVKQKDPITKEIINEFYSIGEAGRQINIDSRRISDACNGKITTVGGYLWEKENGLKNDFNTSKPIVQKNIITNEVIEEYESIADAARKLKLNASTISRFVNKGIESKKRNSFFEYVNI